MIEDSEVMAAEGAAVAQQEEGGEVEVVAVNDEVVDLSSEATLEEQKGDPILVDTDSEATVAVVDAELEEAKAQAADYLERMTRIQAEMDNLRKRTARDVEKAHKFALEPFARELLAVADSMDHGLKAARGSGDIDSLREGVELTRKQLFGALEKFNIEVMDAMGVKFDPEQHEAMTLVPNPELTPNTVMDVIQKGYTLNGRLLRPARVIVSS
jgi:molecular chaperone GrpE